VKLCSAGVGASLAASTVATSVESTTTNWSDTDDENSLGFHTESKRTAGPSE
jgi:hypothetical protein